MQENANSTTVELGPWLLDAPKCAQMLAVLPSLNVKLVVGMRYVQEHVQGVEVEVTVHCDGMHPQFYAALPMLLMNEGPAPDLAMALERLIENKPFQHAFLLMHVARLQAQGLLKV